jgi:hypothetical protein
MRHPRNFFAELRSARARYARNSARLRLAGCSFPHVPEMYVRFLVTFFIASILIAGMASKKGSINFGQKKKAPEPDNLFVNNVSVPRRGRATPPSQASLSLFAILSLLLFLFLPYSFFNAPPKNIAQNKNGPKKKFLLPFFCCSQNFFFCSQIFLGP